MELMISDSSSSETEDELPIFDVRSNSVSRKQNKRKDSEIIEIPNFSRTGIKLSSALDPGIDIPESYVSIYPERNLSEAKQTLKKLAVKGSLNELLTKSVVCQPGFEKQSTVPPYVETRNKTRKERLKLRDMTKGPGWFHLPATEMTEERKKDLMVLQMRKALDPKRFYKRSALKTMPKYFQIGTVVETPADFYNSRIPKRERKQNLVEELLADAEFRKFQKRKYTEALKNQPQKFYHSKRRKTNKVTEARFSVNKKSKTKKKKK